jgi:hypothetical protein
MKMAGHRTRSVFERYSIVDEGDLFEAARKLDLHDSQSFQPKTAGAEKVSIPETSCYHALATAHP